MVRRITLAFIKDRFLLVILFLIFMSMSVKPLNVKEIIYSGVVLTIVLLFHSFLHELGHAITATLLGFKVTRFTINRVYLKDELSSFEEIRNSKNKAKYGIVAISGSIVTMGDVYHVPSLGAKFYQGNHLKAPA